MREYAKVSPQFWVWARQNGLSGDEMLVALYLMTCPASDPLGIYYLVVPEMAHYLGSPLEGAYEALRRVSSKGFCEFDEACSGMVWVRNMARWQVLTDGEPLKASDKRVVGANRWYAKLPKNPFLRRFYDTYKTLLRLSSPRKEDPCKGLGSPSEGVGSANKHPLGSQEHEHEHEHEHDHDLKTYVDLAADRAPAVIESTARADAVREVIAHYRMYHPRALPAPKPTGKEWRSIAARLAEGYSVDRLRAAIDGAHKTPHNLGANANGQAYLGLELIMRSGSQVDRFAETAERVVAGMPIAPRQQMTAQQRALAEIMANCCDAPGVANG